MFTYSFVSIQGLLYGKGRDDGLFIVFPEQQAISQSIELHRVLQ